jgi:outer membrane lipoprotein-sorting protein
MRTGQFKRRKINLKKWVGLFLMLPWVGAAQNPAEIVRKAENKLKGEQSSYTEMSMTIVRPKYQRVIEFKSWSQTQGSSLTVITAPAKDKGQSYLNSDGNIWSWNPAIQRLIKLPPAMMSQGWMGSDFSNDDIVKESSLVSDYTHALLGKESIDGLSCHKIQMIPKSGANIVWGKVIIWISEGEYHELKIEFYDEDGSLVKTHKASKVLDFQGRRIPSVVEIIPADNPGNKTIITIKKIQFNISIAADFFTQQNMKKVQ